MSQIIQNGISDSAIFVLLATTFYVVFSVSKVLHFAHGASFLLGAYIGYTVMKSEPLVLAAICAMLAGGIFGFLCERLLYEPLRARGASNMVLLIGSLALFTLTENVVGMIYGDSSVSVTSTLQDPALHVAGLQFSGVQLLTLAGTVVWVLALAFVLGRTLFGFYVRAIATNQPLADLTGVPSVRVRRLAFFAATAVVGFAGICRMIDLSGTTTMGLDGTLFAVVPFIVGGQRSIWGAVLGGVILGFATNIFAWYFGSEWTEAFLFGLFALIVLVRPEGLIMTRSA